MQRRHLFWLVVDLVVFGVIGEMGAFGVVPSTPLNRVLIAVAVLYPTLVGWGIWVVVDWDKGARRDASH